MIRAPGNPAVTDPTLGTCSLSIRDNLAVPIRNKPTENLEGPPESATGPAMTVSIACFGETDPRHCKSGGGQFHVITFESTVVPGTNLAILDEMTDQQSSFATSSVGELGGVSLTKGVGHGIYRENS